ncbi:MAG TPA: hypothetical protein VNX28_16785, partial [Gemmataceae bacterium]|nr:hypothetical protein [Gemmataceae bacterium]
MPKESTGPEPAPTAQPELLTFLRGKDNPFDVFVAARKPDADFGRLHVPSLYPEVCGALLAVFQRFRPEKLEVDNDVPRSGVVVVLGRRGTGKTHLLHVLRHGLDEGPGRVLVAPAIFEPHRPFLEYLLHQLVRHFQNESEQWGLGMLDLLADAFARQVLAQALHGLTEIDWLARNTAGRFAFWQAVLGWGTRRLVKTKRALIQDLERGRQTTILEIISQHEQHPDDMKRLAVEQIERTETGNAIAGQISRGLYRRLVDRAFGAPAEDLYDFLLDGYTQVEVKNQPSRATLVDALFQTLLELCLLARTPIVFAFDALEALLGDPPDQRLAQLFFQGIAEVLDVHRGLPFLLLAESGHWLLAQKSISPYAQQRFEQGVMRVPTFGTVSTLHFPEVSPKQLADIVATRMAPLLESCREGAEDIPSTYPFTREDLERICRTEGSRPPLRQALQALRDRFEQIVHGAKPPAPVSALPQPITLNLESLETRWQEESRAAKKRL